MIATRRLPIVPTNNRPACVSTVGALNPGISGYGIVASVCSSSASAPRPVPRITATSGTIAVRDWTARTASATATPVIFGRRVPEARRAGARGARETADVLLKLALGLGHPRLDRTLQA